jgi:hypothetical protein
MEELIKRIEELEKRIKELETQPKITYIPYPVITYPQIQPSQPAPWNPYYPPQIWCGTKQ